MKEIDFSQFKLMEVGSKRTMTLAFSVMLDGTMRINEKLKEKLRPNYINIWSGPDGTIILLKAVASEATEACRIAKDGKARVPDLLKTLKNLKIKLPARFIAEWNEKEEKWQAELDPDFTFQMRLPSHNKSVPKKGKIKAPGL